MWSEILARPEIRQIRLSDGIRNPLFADRFPVDLSRPEERDFSRFGVGRFKGIASYRVTTASYDDARDSVTRVAMRGKLRSAIFNLWRASSDAQRRESSDSLRAASVSHSLSLASLLPSPFLSFPPCPFSLPVLYTRRVYALCTRDA